MCNLLRALSFLLCNTYFSLTTSWDELEMHGYIANLDDSPAVETKEALKRL